MKIGIDTNVFVSLFDSAESLNYLKEEGCIIYTYPKCFWEMVKYVKTLKLKDKNTEMVVSEFMKRNNIHKTNADIEREDARAFEEKCKKSGVECHKPDSEIILAFKAEGIQKVYSNDVNFRKSAELIGMEAEKFVF